MNQPEQLVEDVIAAIPIKKERQKLELRKELLSHFLEEKRELELQGYSQEKIFIILQDRFGNTQQIAKQLFVVHSMNKTLLTEIVIVLGIIVMMFILLFGGFAAILFKPII